MGLRGNNISLAVGVPGSDWLVQSKGLPLRRLPFSILLAGIIEFLLRLTKRGAEQ